MNVLIGKAIISDEIRRNYQSQKEYTLDLAVT